MLAQDDVFGGGCGHEAGKERKHARVEDGILLGERVVAGYGLVGEGVGAEHLGGRWDGSGVGVGVRVSGGRHSVGNG